jgi:hypothetical protein
VLEAPSQPPRRSVLGPGIGAHAGQLVDDVAQPGIGAGRDGVDRLGQRRAFLAVG